MGRLVSISRKWTGAEWVRILASDVKNMIHDESLRHVDLECVYDDGTIAGTTTLESLRQGAKVACESGRCFVSLRTSGELRIWPC